MSNAVPKDLPSVDRLLRRDAVAGLLAEHSLTPVAGEARALLDSLRGLARRRHFAAQCRTVPARRGLLRASRYACAPCSTSPARSFTLTLSALPADAALQHPLVMMAGPNNLPYDLDFGGRGDRDAIVEELLCSITDAQTAALSTTTKRRCC